MRRGTRRSEPPSFPKDNKLFERWLRGQCQVVEKDLELKHERMQKDAFDFLRATFFRWARRIEAICPHLVKAPAVLSVGDVHLENFGTWRDRDGRLVWGVNDFDDAAMIPYPFDLVRLATSARLAPGLKLNNRRIASAILNGYREGLKNPRPTLLDEQETWMRPFVACTDEERTDFWNEIDELPTAEPPPKVVEGLINSFPEKEEIKIERFASRVKGGGGLGRPRYVMIAEWRGGRVVREAKAAVTSAWDWVHDERPNESSPFMKLAKGRCRSPDPHLAVHDRFIIRRISADSRKIELGPQAGEGLHLDLLEAMGFDLASIHAADERRAIEVQADLYTQPLGWLYEAANGAASAVQVDYRAWKKYCASLRKKTAA